MKLARIAVVAYIAAMTGNAVAATDGTLGGTSEGTAVINISKQNAVKITNLDDINLGTFGSLTATTTGADDVCVFSSTGGYGLVMTSANDGFSMAATGTTTTIDYSVEWEANLTSDLTYNSMLPGLIGDSSDVDCNGQTNATFTISIEPNAFNAAEPGSYTDTLTMLVQPL